MTAAMLSALAGTLITLVILLLAARLGARIARRVGQPEVLGELLAGLAVGNLATLAGVDPGLLSENVWIGYVALAGAILLMFEVGLESSVAQMMNVGRSSLLVATFGVIGPLALGWLTSAWLLPDASPFTHLFIGATLTATSIGITARY